MAYERIPTRFATCNTSLSGISIAVICDLTVATVRLTTATILFSRKQCEHCGVSPSTTTKNDALLNPGRLHSANLVWYPRVFGLIWAGNTVLSLTYCWWTMSINMRKLFADGAQCSLVCMALCDLSLIQIAPRRYHLIHLDLDSLKARIGWPSPNVTRAPLVGDSQYLHRILLAPKQKNTSYIDIACPRENLIWVVNSSAAVHRPATGVALASDFFCQQKFLVAVNLLMRKSGFWNLFCHVSYLAAHPLRWPETQAVDCEVESCMRGVQSTVTGFPIQHLHSLFSPAGCYYEVSTNATSCSSTGKETPEVVLANKQHWNRHLDVLVEALQYFTGFLILKVPCKFLVGVNLLMRKSGFWNLFCLVSYLAAYPLRWPETQAVDCEVESCMRGVQSTVTGFPHQHLHSLFSPAGCYYEVSTNATSCSSTGKETPEVVLANKQHWNRHLDVLVEALQYFTGFLIRKVPCKWWKFNLKPIPRRTTRSLPEQSKEQCNPLDQR